MAHENQQSDDKTAGSVYSKSGARNSSLMRNGGLAELGLSDTIKVEHIFTFNLGEKWDKPLRKAAESYVDIGYHWAESFRILVFGMSTCFILIGLARLVEATKSTDRPSGGSTGGSSSSSRSSHVSSSSSKSKASSSKVTLPNTEAKK